MSKEESTYLVSFPTQSKDGLDLLTRFMLFLLIIFFLFSMLFMLPSLHSERLNIAISTAAFILLGGTLYFLIIQPQVPPVCIRVSGETFCVDNGKAHSKTYKFSDITRIRCYVPLHSSSRGAINRREPCWQIFVGDLCVAIFSLKMQNGLRFYKKLDSLGLIPKIRP